ncbi:hypothetical protein BWQ96_03713 [Gracilariopsis chorda]|uniref:Uncharacterized protein n=1 Tax=Gracilariopsis chorda TaxID=448386 RepID=A0A2V3IWG4_9FLOR|nr:hypothetical protein BWQ96_03713 [Gracilariopsis chorda]|eukprot:PXF46478.1 hypothetical protein BWQ96_03713 [Gracilariopsis chorda]
MHPRYASSIKDNKLHKDFESRTPVMVGKAKKKRSKQMQNVSEL